MSEHDDPAAGVPKGPTGDSLSDRMARRREYAERVTTEIFPIAGPWSDMVAVELRMLGWKAMRKIGDKHERVRDETLAELYTSADQLIAATEGFYEIDGDGHYTPLPRDTWPTLARRAKPEVGEDLSPRQALFVLIQPDSVVPMLWQDWQNWVKAAKVDTDEEVVADFG